MWINTKHTPFQGFASKPSTAHNLNVSSKETVVRTVSLPTVSNKVSGMTLPARYLTVDTGSVLERRKFLLQNPRGQQKDRWMGSRQMDWQEATDIHDDPDPWITGWLQSSARWPWCAVAWTHSRCIWPYQPQRSAGSWTQSSPRAPACTRLSPEDTGSKTRITASNTLQVPWSNF